MHTRPWHHWPVTFLALLIYAVGALDYIGLKYQIALHMAYLTPDQTAYLTNLPLVADVAWALGVWGGLAGAVVLAGQGRTAATLFAVSFLGLIIATAWLVYLTEPPFQTVTGMTGLYVLIGAIVVAFLFFLYARAMNVRQASI